MDEHILRPQSIVSEQHVSAPKLRFRSGFAVQNLTASANFARIARGIEDTHCGQPLGPFWDEIRWNVTAAIVLSATGLEANINEHLLDEECLPNLDKVAKSAFVQLLEPKPLLEKYQFVAELHSGSKIDEGSEPYQSTRILVRLRNAIVHFVPEWTDEQTMHARLGQLLAGKFQPSPFFSSSEPLFPDRCMSADCARWATSTVLAFVQAFHRQCNTKGRFTERHAERILGMLPVDA